MLGTPISPKTRPTKGKDARQAIELQELLMRDANNDQTSAAVRAQIARAWGDLQKLRLQMAMKPAPKPIDVSTLKRGKAKASLAPEAPTSTPTTKPQDA